MSVCVCVCFFEVSFDINTAGLLLSSMKFACLFGCRASGFVFHLKLINLFFFLSHTRRSHHELSLILCSHSTEVKGKCDHSYYHLITLILAERFLYFTLVQPVKLTGRKWGCLTCLSEAMVSLPALLDSLCKAVVWGDRGLGATLGGANTSS